MSFGMSSSSVKKNLSDSRISEDIQKLSKIPVMNPVRNTPDPSKYTMLRYYEQNGFLLVELKYDHCTNYEGHKILLFKDVTMIDLFNQKLIDPHFLVDSGYHHPIARFVPNQNGWDMAMLIIGQNKKPVYRGGEAVPLDFGGQSREK